MAVASFDYKFQWINVGAKGSASDGGVYRTTDFYRNIHDVNNPLNIPESRALPDRTIPIPMCIIGDDAFPVSERLMKPIAGNRLSRIDKICNYRLSRARRVIENCFGISSAKFRILRKPIEHNVENTTRIVSAVCLLHNFLIDESKNTYLDENEIDENEIDENENIQEDEQEIGLQHEPPPPNPRFNSNLRTNEYKEYFMSYAGEVQYDQIH